MDRTNWMLGKFKINILYLAINYKGMAIPLPWTLLSKKGCSNTQERIELLQKFRKIFPEQPVRRLLADRQFKGKKWLKYLKDHNWPFCLRVPINTQIPNKHQNRLLPARRVWGQTVYQAAAKKGDELMVIVCDAGPGNAIADYLQRWQIETMFQAMKSRGFNLEQTHLSSRERLSKLLCILALSFCWSYKTGDALNEDTPITVKSHGRKAQSIFRAGLDHLQRIFDHIETWLDEFFWSLRLLFQQQGSEAS